MLSVGLPAIRSWWQIARSGVTMKAGWVALLGAVAITSKPFETPSQSPTSVTQLCNFSRSPPPGQSHTCHSPHGDFECPACPHYNEKLCNCTYERPHCSPVRHEQCPGGRPCPQCGGSECLCPECPEKVCEPGTVQCFTTCECAEDCNAAPPPPKPKPPPPPPPRPPSPPVRSIDL